MAAKSYPVPDDFTDEQLVRATRWFIEQYRFRFTLESDRKAMMRRELDGCLDWARVHGGKASSGHRIIDYEAFYRNWLRRTMTKMGVEPRRPPSSPTNARGKQPFDKSTNEMENLGPLFQSAVPKKDEP